MSTTETILRVLLASGAFMALCALCFFAVRWARQGGRGRHAVGAMLMLFSWGNMRDPRNDTVAEARTGRIRKGGSSGDPLDGTS